jgi:flavodoxin
MKSVIVYYSRFGHTERLAGAMAERLATVGIARAVAVEQFTAADVLGADLVVMGSPTHRMRLPPEMQPVFQSLHRGALRGAAVAAFDTSYRMSAFLAHFTAAKTLGRKLRRLGGKQVAQPETFYMVAREGPLEVGEIERAQAWAVGLLTKMGTPMAADKYG